MAGEFGNPEIVEETVDILMIGGGVVYAGASSALVDFAEQLDLPAVQTFMGLGILRNDHPLSLGMLGMHGAPYTNLVLEECDLVIGMGVRFDDRATGKVVGFCPGAEIIHVDMVDQITTLVPNFSKQGHAFEIGTALRASGYR